MTVGGTVGGGRSCTAAGAVGGTVGGGRSCTAAGAVGGTVGGGRSCTAVAGGRNQSWCRGWCRGAPEEGKEPGPPRRGGWRRRGRPRRGARGVVGGRDWLQRLTTSCLAGGGVGGPPTAPCSNVVIGVGGTSAACSEDGQQGKPRAPRARRTWTAKRAARSPLRVLLRQHRAGVAPSPLRVLLRQHRAGVAPSSGVPPKREWDQRQCQWSKRSETMDMDHDFRNERVRAAGDGELSRRFSRRNLFPKCHVFCEKSCVVLVAHDRKCGKICRIEQKIRQERTAAGFEPECCPDLRKTTHIVEPILTDVDKSSP